MGLSELPPELRYSIYQHWFSGRTFKPDQPWYIPYSRHHLYRQSWLSDAFVISKAISTDPWLIHAILHDSTFHLETTTDLTRLQSRFGDAALQTLTRISLGSAMTTDATIQQLQRLMPQLRHIEVTGSLDSLSRVWDHSLRDFENHEWAPFIACLCVFAPHGTPGMDSILTERALSEQVELTVNFKWEDPDVGYRKMSFSTKDWLVRYQYLGREVALKQVRPEDLEAVLGEIKAS